MDPSAARARARAQNPKICSQNYSAAMAENRAPPPVIARGSRSHERHRDNPSGQSDPTVQTVKTQKFHQLVPKTFQKFSPVGANYDLVIASYISKTVAWSQSSRENLTIRQFHAYYHWRQKCNASGIGQSRELKNSREIFDTCENFEIGTNPFSAQNYHAPTVP
jgi:hypothetical protein